MKESILFLLILASILSACQSAPQVTVTSEATVTLTPPPTETPIPTPTLHPQFVEIQEQVAASGGRFSLQADGTILDDTEPIPGLTVTPDGTMTLTVNGETVTLDPADVDFDDEIGITIVGYELDEETGAWVIEVSTPEELWQAELGEWQLNPEEYSEKKDLDGNLAMVKKSTGEIVYWVDENGVGYWNLQVMRKMIVETKQEDKECYPTRWVGVEGQSVPPRDDSHAFYQLFMNKLSDIARQEKLKLGLLSVLPKGFMSYLGGDNNCWATEAVEGLGQNPELLERTYIFWMNKGKELRYEQVFSPRAKKIVLATE